MSVQTEMLGGRLPLLDPQALSAQQKETYDRLNTTWVAWADSVPFQSKTEDGRSIGPFNPILFSPAISSSFLDFQETEQKDTSLSQRVPPSRDLRCRRRVESQLRALRSFGGGPKGRHFRGCNPNASDRWPAG